MLTKLQLRALGIGVFIYVLAVLGFSVLGTIGANIGPLSMAIYFDPRLAIYFDPPCAV